MAEHNGKTGSDWNIAKWIFDQEIENIKENLIIKGDSAKVSAADVLSYGLEDVEELEGAKGSARVSLNPKDWTAEELRKTLIDRPLGSITDWTEYRATGKAAIWEDLTTGHTEMGGSAGPRDRYRLYDRDAKKIRETSPLKKVRLRDAQSASKFPGAVYDPGEGAYVVWGRKGTGGYNIEDEYAGASAATAKYMSASVATTKRNKALHDFNVEAVKSWTKEIDSLTPAKNANFASYTAAHQTAINDYHTSLSKKVEALNAADMFSDTVGKLLENNNKKIIISSLKAYDKDLKREIDFRVRFDRSFKLLEGRLNSLDTQGKQEAAELISAAERIRRQLYDPAGNITNSSGKIFGTLKVENEKLHRETLNTGAVGKFSGNVIKNLQNDNKFKDLLKAGYADPATGATKTIISKSGRNLMNVTHRVYMDWAWEATDDVITDIFEGKLPRQILWDRAIAPRLTRYTPSFWIGKGVRSFANVTGISKALGAYESAWTSLQKKTIGKVMGAFQYNLQLLKRRIGDFIEQIFTKYLGGALAGATAGLSLVLAKVLGKVARIVTQVVINRIIDFGGAAWKAVKSLDFKELDELAAKAVKSMLIAATSFAACLGVIVVFVVMIISGILTAFGWDDSTKTATDISEFIIQPEGLYAFGGYTVENCPVSDTLDLTFQNSSSNGAARNAYDLVEGLLRGFWCYWNHSPDYDSANDPDDLFNEIEFSFNSFPGSGIRNCGDCLFWCTWLPIIAWRDAGNDFDPSVEYLGAQNMYEFFRNEQVFVDPAQPGSAGRIQPGDIAFFQTGGGSGWHTGMVYYVNQDVVMTIHSNAPYKELGLTVAINGAIQSPDDVPITVVGFGRPK